MIINKLFMSLKFNFSTSPSHFRLHSTSLSANRVSAPTRPLNYYKNLVNQGNLKYDSFQEKIAIELDKLLGRLDQYEEDMREYHAKLAKWEENREIERRKLLMEEANAIQEGGALSTIKKRRTILQRWMSRDPANVEPGGGKWVSYLNREKKLDSLVGPRPRAPPAPKGLYIYGNVGSGKTMLMDMFYSATEGIVQHRRWLHFHEAMLQIHYLMHKEWRSQETEKSLQSSLSNWVMNLPFDTKIKEWLVEEEKYKQEMKMKNILLAVADKFLVDGQERQKGASILCFDEVQTVDVFAIIALSGILSRLLSSGTVLVATSNRAPKDLNQDGMQKEIFQELVASLEEHCENVVIGSEIDYRRKTAQSSIDEVGAADYIAIAKAYHTIFITDIPIMSMRIRDKARRFITLIDELYNYHCQLYCSAAASIDDLFQGTEEGTLFDLESFQFETETEDTKLRRDVLAEGRVSSGGTSTGVISLYSGQEERFAFQRAVSRLIEMQTPLYLNGVGRFHPYFQGKERVPWQ